MSSILPLRVHSDAKLTLALEQSHDRNVSPDVRLNLDLRIPFGELMEQMQQFLKLHGANESLVRDLRQWLPGDSDSDEYEDEDEESEDENDDDDEEEACEDEEDVEANHDHMPADVAADNSSPQLDLDFADNADESHSASRPSDDRVDGTPHRMTLAERRARARENIKRCNRGEQPQQQKDLLLFPEADPDPLGLAAVIGRTDSKGPMIAERNSQRQEQTPISGESTKASPSRLPKEKPIVNNGNGASPSDAVPGNALSASDLLFLHSEQTSGAGREEVAPQLTDAFGRPVCQSQTDFSTSPVTWHAGASMDFEPRGFGRSSSPDFDPEPRGIGRST